MSERTWTERGAWMDARRAVLMIRDREFQCHFMSPLGGWTTGERGATDTYAIDTAMDRCEHHAIEREAAGRATLEPLCPEGVGCEPCEKRRAAKAERATPAAMCPRCRGARRVDMDNHDDVTYMTCPRCKGTGVDQAPASRSPVADRIAAIYKPEGTACYLEFMALKNELRGALAAQAAMWRRRALDRKALMAKDNGGLDRELGGIAHALERCADDLLGESR